MHITSRDRFRPQIGALIEFARAQGLEGERLHRWCLKTKPFDWSPYGPYPAKIWRDEIRSQLGLKKRKPGHDDPLPLFPDDPNDDPITVTVTDRDERSEDGGSPELQGLR